MDYTYLKYKDVYTITNNSSVETLTYKIVFRNCEETTVIKEGTILPSSVYTLSFKYDGVYEVILNDVFAEEVITNIRYFENTLQMFIEGVQNIFCGCKHNCDECTDCDDCAKILNTLDLANGYYYSNFDTYQSYVEATLDTIQCEIISATTSSVTKAMINGKLNTEDLYKLLIYAHYMAFYARDYVYAVDIEEAEYYKAKYNFAVISACLKKAGRNTSVQEILETQDMRVYYWQTEDLNLEIGDITPSKIPTLSNDVYSPFSEFESGKYVNYSLVGKVIFAIQEKLIPNFRIYDDSQDDITNAFDTVYFATERVTLFVSKVLYSEGSVYFKFKKIYNG